MAEGQFDPTNLADQINQYLKDIYNPEETAACGAMIKISSTFRLIFLRIVSVSIEEALSLKSLWELSVSAINAVMDFPNQHGINKATSTSLSSHASRLFASIKSIEVFLKVVLSHAPFGVDSETGKPKACAWKSDSKTRSHPLLNEQQLRSKCESLISKLLQWSASEVFGSSSVFKTTAEICCVNSCLSMIALSSPFHYPSCAQSLCRSIYNHKKYLSETDNIDAKIKKYNFKQTQRKLSLALATESGEAAAIEDDDEDLEVIQYYQFLMVYNSIKNHGTLLIRYGRSGVRMMKLTSVQERERFMACDKLTHVLTQVGMSSQVAKMLPGYQPSRELIGVIQAEFENNEEAQGKDAKKGGEEGKRTDPRLKSNDTVSSNKPAATQPLTMQGLDSEATIKTMGSVPLQPLDANELNRYNHEAWIRIFTYGDYDVMSESSKKRSHGGDELSVSKSQKQHYFRKTNNHFNNDQSSNGYQRLSLQLGHKSIFREGTLVKLALMNDLNPTVAYPSSVAPDPSTSSLMDQILAKPSYLNNGILDNILDNYACEIDLLLTMFYELFEKESQTSKKGNGQIHKTYECLLMKVVKHILESKADKAKFRLLKRVVIECPYLPERLCYYVGWLCSLYSGMHFRYDEYGNYGQGDVFLNTGLNLLKIIITERGGPISSRLASLESSLQLAMCGHVLLPLSVEGSNIRCFPTPYPPLYTTAKAVQADDYGKGEALDKECKEDLITDSVGKESIRKQCITMVSLTCKASIEMKPLIEFRVSSMLNRLDQIARSEMKRKEIEREKALRGDTTQVDKELVVVADAAIDEHKMQDEYLAEEKDEALEEEEEEGAVIVASQNVFKFQPLTVVEEQMRSGAELPVSFEDYFEGDIDIIQVRYLLELPLHLCQHSPDIVKHIINLYAAVVPTAKSTSTALAAAAHAARQAASTSSKEGTQESEMNNGIEADVSSAVNNAKRLFPQISGYITETVEKNVDAFIKYIDNDYSKLSILREVSPQATPLILHLFAKIASLETLSPSLPKANELLHVAFSMESAFRSPNIRFVIPFLGACDRNKFAMVLPRLLPWTSDDLNKAIESGSLAAMTANTPGPPLSIQEFEKAVRYRINAAGPIGSEQANSSGAELIELLIRLGNSNTISNQPHMMRCLFSAFKVLLSIDVISLNAIQRVLIGMANEPQTPLYFMRFLLECSKHKTALAQSICTQVIPSLIQHKVWSEKERWQGFLLLVKKYCTARPPHCLQALLLLPPLQLEQLLKLNEASKPTLASYVRLTYGGDVNAAYGSGMASINTQILKLLEIC